MPPEPLSRRSFCAAAAMTPAALLAVGRPGRAAADPERDARAAALTRWVAERYALPGSGGQLATPQPLRGVPDPQKYVWPKVIARLTRDPADAWSLAALAQFWPAGGDPAPHEASFYHFAAYGLARLLFSFPARLKPHRDALLAEAMRQEQLFSADGTENHIAMWRTSGYLFAQEAGDARRVAQMRDWIAGYRRRLYQNGQGEWDSSTYAAFDIASWLNLTDFARDHSVQDDARAVVDLFAASLALKWAFGALAGAEKRGFSGGSVDAISSYVAWLWFGDTAEDHRADGFFTQSAIYAMTPARSRYRPPAEVVSLARKSGWARADTYVISRPNYAMTRPHESVEVYRADARHAVGASVVSPIGGWGGGDTQETLWKLAVRGPGGTDAAAAVAVFGGAGAGYAERMKYNGEGRSPWDQVVLHGNVLLQLTRVPEDADEITAQARALFDEWKAKGNAKKVSWTDPKPEPWAYVSLPDASGVVAVAEKRGAIFAAVTQPGAGMFYVAVTPIGGALEWLNSGATKAKGRRVARVNGKRGEVVGFAWEWGDETTDPGGFAAFQSAVLSRPDRLAREDAATVRYVERTGGRTLRARFGTSGTYTEPEYDWGPQPVWPSGEGHGRVPSLWVNGQAVDHTRDHGLLFDGPRLRLPRGGRLAVRGA